jgi:hypothetical protein
VKIVKNNCSSNIECTFLSIAAAIIVGIVTAILQFTAIITVGTVFPWVALGVAIVYLLALVVFAPSLRNAARGCCVCRVISVIIAGLLGTIITALILLAVTFAATSVLGAIFAGLLLGFFTLFVTAAACLLKCAVNCDDEE